MIAPETLALSAPVEVYSRLPVSVCTALERLLGREVASQFLRNAIERVRPQHPRAVDLDPVQILAGDISEWLLTADDALSLREASCAITSALLEQVHRTTGEVLAPELWEGASEVVGSHREVLEQIVWPFNRTRMSVSSATHGAGEGALVDA
jgi:hypothetical protein